MKKIASILILALAAGSALAKTALFGEANGYTQLKASEAGSTLQVHGYMTEFGIRGDADMTNNSIGFFELTMGANITEGWSTFVKAGQVGTKTAIGSFFFFYGDTPLSGTNQYLQLMPQDPDSLAGAFGYVQAQNAELSIGLGGVDGLFYSSPMLTDQINVDVALIPAEVEGGETGFSFASHFKNKGFNASAAFEINAEAANTQVLRIIGDQKIGLLAVGASLQVVGNSQQDTSARSLIGFTKFPLSLGRYNTQVKWLLGYNQVTLTNDDTESQMYASLVQEIPFGSKVSSYVFSELEWGENLSALTSYTGLGLKITF